MVESWETFFVAETAAAAALLGLLFVAFSINLKAVIESKGLADRALGALMLLLAILIAGLLLAMPDQPKRVMGIEVIVLSVLTGTIITALGLRGLRAAEPRFRANYHQNIIFNLVAVAPLGVGGVLMLGGGEAGFYWVAAGMCASLVKAVSEGWIFLVEINR